VEQTVNPSQIAKEFEDFHIRQAYGRPAHTSDFTVKVYHEETLLFNFEDSTNVLEINKELTEDLKLGVREIIDRSGLYNLEVEFMPSTISKTDRSQFTMKKRTDQDFQNWLRSVCLSLASKLYFIPDTSFLMRQYYSNHIKPYMDPKRMFLRIPRLAIIEIENRYNKTVKEIKEKKKKDGKEIAKAKREAFLTMSEILSIKHGGGDILENVDLSLLQSFAPNAGTGFADAWIRREILSNHGLNTEQGQSGTTSSKIFLTCDHIGAMAAVAENINTLYFYRIEDDDKKPKPIGNQLGLLIVNTAIQLNKCSCVLSSQQKSIAKDYCGMWPGKSAFEWENNFVRDSTVI
jgi:hypothetical protein